MKICKRYRRLAFALALLTANAVAASPESSNGTWANGTWYVGGGLGVSEVNDLCSNGTLYGCDDTGGAVRLFGGLQMNRYFALEAALDLNGDYRSPGATGAGYDGSTDAYFLSLNAIGFLPMSERVSLYGGVSGAFSYVATDVTATRYHNGSYSTCYYDGYSYYDEWYYYCTDNYDDRDYRSDTSVAGGALLGIDVKVADRVHVRAQAQRFFNVQGDLAFGGRRDIDQFTVNGLFMFR